MRVGGLMTAVLCSFSVIAFCGIASAQVSDLSTESAFYEMTRSAPTEFSKGKLDRAESIANQLLKEAPNWEKNWNYGNAIQAGNIVLGRIALRRGEVNSAKKYLIAAGNTPGSPQLNSFGPDMTLARDLLAKGEKDVVLEYFDLCSRFWESSFSKLNEWRSDIREDRLPKFGPNLKYLGF